MPDPSQALMRIGTSDNILIQLNAFEALSGISSIKAFFKSPTGNQTKEITFDPLTDKLPGTNLYQKTFQLAGSDVEGGTWTFDYAIITDNNGNIRTQRHDEVGNEALKSLEFEVNNLPSTKPAFGGKKDLARCSH